MKKLRAVTDTYTDVRLNGTTPMHIDANQSMLAYAEVQAADDSGKAAGKEVCDSAGRSAGQRR